MLKTDRCSIYEIKESDLADVRILFTDDEVRVSLRGGDLLIRFDRESNHLFMTGSAKEVFHGSIDIPQEIYYDLSEK